MGIGVLPIQTRHQEWCAALRLRVEPPHPTPRSMIYDRKQQTTCSCESSAACLESRSIPPSCPDSWTLTYLTSPELPLVSDMSHMILELCPAESCTGGSWFSLSLRCNSSGYH